MACDTRTILVVGGVAGGASAAARARRINETARIVLIEKDEHVSFANCGLPYYLGGEITDRSKLLVATPAKFAAWFNIDVRAHTEALAIDRTGRTLTVRNPDGSTEQLPYDRLILAPGASPIVPPIPGTNAENLFTLRNLADTDRIKAFLDQRKPRRAVVIGAGFIGLEMVEMLKGLGLDVALVELADQVLPPLDREMAHMVQVELQRHGVHVHLGNGLKSLVSEGNNVRQVILNDGTALDADLVIMGIGVRPNTRLAIEAGLAVGATGGITVNRYMQTSDPVIYAVGDAVEYHHGVVDADMRIPLAGPANRSGRVAGEHAAADESPAMSPVLGTAIVRVFSVTAAMTGLSQKMVTKLGRAATAVWVGGNSHAAYYPGAQAMTLKLVFDPVTSRVLGAQAVGGEGVDKRIDVLATAIQMKASVDDLTALDLAYAPPFGSAKDVIHMAAFAAQNHIRGLDTFAPPAITGDIPEGTQLLDVRNADEFATGHLPNATLIPLPQLRRRIGELDKGKPILLMCRGGQRAYIASRILRAHGFTYVKTVSGGMLMQEHVGK